ncbi:LacI family DNA-binding transcriptional regulator [Bacillus sp. HMF5848]|uniref:LacI family DNA-binding transcriptional regulator n=1 Tax=Bacillus sp. HMF5848 TaxID=2495421 RepID=UPI00163A7F60|nr:LacI family DNA-binding transcriptional regulator [Bacillus sp. HMF5848]
MKKITMKEIAKLANVSQPTVSRVINGNKGVNEEAAKRVLDAIQKVGYVPNKAAQTLKQSNSKIIGVCVSEIYNPYFVELIDTLELEARKKDYNIIFHNSKHNPITEWENIQNFIARQVDGIIIVPTSDYNIQKIKDLRTPAISITQNKKHIDSVGLDHRKGGELAAASFIHSGHNSFAYIGTTPEDEKLIGFKSCLYENGFSFDMKNYIHVEESSTNNYLMRRDLEKYFNRVGQPDFTCVFATNDIVALEFMKLAQEKSLSIPKDIAVIGFDDTFLAKITGLSSVHQPVEKMVKTTFSILMNRIEDGTSSELVDIKLEPTLITRQSSNIKRT